jgi:hypothetical protein
VADGGLRFTGRGDLEEQFDFPLQDFSVSDSRL